MQSEKNSGALVNSLLVLSVLFIFAVAFSSQGDKLSPTGMQLSCGIEAVSTGAGGEVRMKIQTGGTEDSVNCSPTACNAGMRDVGILTDKYTDSGSNIFSYQRVCINGVDSGEIKNCTASLINNEATGKCDPPACPQGQWGVVVYDLRDTNQQLPPKWNQISYRVCVAGTRVQAMCVTGNDNYSSFADPPACSQGYDSVGVFKQIHFDSQEYHRSTRVCIQLAPASTTTTSIPPSSTTTTTNPPTTSTLANATNASSTTTTAETTTTTMNLTTTTTTTIATTTTTTVTTNNNVASLEAYSVIQQANQTILEAQVTKNVSEAINIYLQAIDAYNSGDYDSAKILALQSTSSIKEYTKPQQEFPMLYVLFGAVAVLIITVGIFYYLKTKKKQTASFGGTATPELPPSTNRRQHI